MYDLTHTVLLSRIMPHLQKPLHIAAVSTWLSDHLHFIKVHYFANVFSAWALASTNENKYGKPSLAQK